jgi:hypothetical protein
MSQEDRTTPPSGDFSKLTINGDQDNYNPDAPSPGAMMVDQPEEHVVEPNGTDTEELAIINPDSEHGHPPANDCLWIFYPPRSSPAIDAN